MSSRIRYTDEPLGDLRVVPDFLPSPEELAFREESVKITIVLNKRSVDFFKSEAAEYHTRYQRMIRQLIDSYVDGQQRDSAAHASRARKERVGSE